QLFTPSVAFTTNRFLPSNTLISLRRSFHATVDLGGPCGSGSGSSWAVSDARSFLHLGDMPPWVTPYILASCESFRPALIPSRIWLSVILGVFISVPPC